MPNSKTWKQMKIKSASSPKEKNFDIFFKEEIIDTHIIINKINERKSVFKKEELATVERLLQKELNA